MGVSKNRGNPKSSILIGFSFINYKPSILGYHWVPLWLETSIWKRCGIIIITHDPLIVSSQLLGSQTIWVTAHLTKFIPWRSWGWREQKTPGGRMLKFLEMRRVKRCAKSGMRRRWFRFLSQAGFGKLRIVTIVFFFPMTLSVKWQYFNLKPWETWWCWEFLW